MTLPTKDEMNTLFNDVHDRIGGFSAFNEAFKEMIKSADGFKIGQEFLKRSFHWNDNVTASSIWTHYMTEGGSPEKHTNSTFYQYINEFRGNVGLNS